MKKFNKVFLMLLFVFVTMLTFVPFGATKVNAQEIATTAIGDVSFGTWGGVDWTFEVLDENGNGKLTIAPTTGEPVTDNGKQIPYEVGEWRENVYYDPQTGNYINMDTLPYNPQKVVELDIKEGVTKIGSFVAQSMMATGELIIPSTVTYIGQSAFQGAKFTSLTFAEGSQLKCISTAAFKNMVITEVLLPEGLEDIHLWAFEKCANLQKVYFPSTVVDMDGYQHLDYYPTYNYYATFSENFADCNNLKVIEFGSEAIKETFLRYIKTDHSQDGVRSINAVTRLGAYSDIQQAIDVASNDDGVVTLWHETQNTLTSQGIMIDTDKSILIPPGVKVVVPQGKTVINKGTIVNLGEIAGEGTINNNEGKIRLVQNSIADTITVDGGEDDSVCAVILDYGTSDIVNQVLAVAYDTLLELQNPVFDGYLFMGWYADSDCQTPFDFGVAIKVQTTIYAKLADYDGEMAKINGAIESLQGAISGLNTALEAKEDSTIIAQKIQELNNAITSAMETAKGYTDQTASSLLLAIGDAKTQAIDTARGLVMIAQSQLTEAINLKADASTLNQMVNELNTAIATAETVAKNYTDQKVVELTSAIETAKGNAIESARVLIEEAKKELNEAINLKADTATLTQKVKELNSAISTAEETSKAYTDQKVVELTSEIATAKGDAIESAKVMVEEAKKELNEAINQKVDTATLTQKIEDLNSAISTAEETSLAYTDQMVQDLTTTIASAKAEAIEIAKNIVEEATAQLKTTMNLRFIIVTIVVGLSLVGNIVLFVMILRKKQK